FNHQETKLWSFHGELDIGMQGIIFGAIVKKGKDDQNVDGTLKLCSAPRSSTQISGYWTGMAEPDESLTDFMIPVNPIDWSFSIFGTEVFGCGFVTESGDVPGHPILFYTLEGKFNPETKELEMSKVYEEHEETK